MIRHRHRILVALLCAPALWAAHVSGAITSSTKQSTSPAAIEPVVREFISGELKQLQSNTPAAQKTAKDSLVAECTGRDVTPSAEYQQTYMRVLAQQLQGLTKSTVLRTRLNAGIIATEVAEQTVKAGGAGVFEPLATALINDKEEAVLLWGVKLAKYVIGDLAIAGKSPGTMDKAVIEVVKSHPNTGYLAEEAYSALTLEPYQNSDDFGKAAPAVLLDLLNLMKVRTAQYAAAVPASPQAEEKATVFLAVRAYPAASAPATRNRVLAALGEAACAVLNQIAAGNNPPELISVARAEGGALQVFGNNFSSPALTAAGQAIISVGQNTPTNTVTANCTSLVNALKGMGVPINPPAPPGGAPDQSAGAK